MQDEFDIWKNRLEDADNKALNEGFDKDAMWRNLQARIQQPKKRSIWLYAAAAIAGLLVGGLLMRILNNSNPQSVIVKQVAIQQAPAVDTEQVHVAVNIAPQSAHTVVVIKQGSAKQMKPIQQQVQSITKPEQVIDPQELTAGNGPLGLPVKDEALEVAPVKVVHLLDIHNEDKASMVHTRQSASARPAVVRAFNELHHPDLQSDAGPGSIVSGIFK